VVTLSTQLEEPPGTSTRTSQISVSTTNTKTRSRKTARQNETRRRAITSSSFSSGSSIPYRLGHGIRRRIASSTAPRNATTMRNVAASDQATL
jgi:hypothetical protein